MPHNETVPMSREHERMWFSKLGHLPRGVTPGVHVLQAPTQAGKSALLNDIAFNHKNTIYIPLRADPQKHLCQDNSSVLLDSSRIIADRLGIHIGPSWLDEVAQGRHNMCG
jgi:hypothetical protein